MTKRELIDEIMNINHSAKPEFLAHFKETHLVEYLEHLNSACAARISGPARPVTEEDACFSEARPTFASPGSVQFA